MSGQSRRVEFLLLRATEYGNRGWPGLMRERAATPTIHGKTERPLEGAFFVSRTASHAARETRDALEHLLQIDGAALRASLPPGFADAAEAYVRLLLTANERLNLTRVVEPDAIARLHVLDALAGLPLVDL